MTLPADTKTALRTAAVAAFERAAAAAIARHRTRSDATDEPSPAPALDTVPSTPAEDRDAAERAA